MMRRCPGRKIPHFIGFLLAGLLLTACMVTPASPTPPLAPTASQTPVPTFTPVATPSPPASPTAVPATPSPAASPTAPPRIEHVLLISVDGLSPAALAQAKAPNIAHLWQNGAYSWQAQTVLPSSTLPAHAAMLTGQPPEVTGATENNWAPGDPYIPFPTVLSLAHQAGLPTAAFVGKEKLEALLPPDAVDKVVVTYGDAQIAAAAAGYITQEQPALIFAHLPGVDAAGHSSGWLSADQLQAVERADAAVGQLLLALDQAGIATSSAVLLTSDHGGHGIAHGSDLPQDTTIVWILYGPGIAAGKELSTPIHTYDTAATVAYALGLPVPKEWRGRPVQEAFLTAFPGGLVSAATEK